MFGYHTIRMTTTGEYRFFRGDKGVHFMNILAAVDFTGMFIHVEPGYAGCMPDRIAYQESYYTSAYKNKMVKYK